MKKLIYTGTLLIFVCPAIACGQDFAFPQLGNNSKASLADMECYMPFEEFAYTPKVEGYGRGLPTEPWQIESTFFDEHVDVDIQAMFARSFNGRLEIWFANPNQAFKRDSQSVFIYYPESREWHSVPDTVEGTGAFIRGVYLGKDGTVWGDNGWEWEEVPNGPILSIFSEKTQQFEFAPGLLDYPLTADGESIAHDFLFDSQGNIWILVSNDGIYFYDVIAQTSTKQINLDDIIVSAVVGLSDGSIYFTENAYLQRTAGDSDCRIFDGMLYQFVPASGVLLELGTPNEPWPLFGSMFETSHEKVWFSAVGYRDFQDGSWRLLHSDPEYAFEHAWYPGSDSPNITLESSTGLLWFNKNDNMLSGIAWYDAETGEGYMFTHLPTNIVEDDRQQLWMFADGKLYRYALE